MLFLKPTKIDPFEITPQEFGYGKSLIVSGEYWEVKFDISYLLDKLEIAKCPINNNPKIQILLKDYLGRTYSDYIPMFPHNLVKNRRIKECTFQC